MDLQHISHNEINHQISRIQASGSRYLTIDDVTEDFIIRCWEKAQRFVKLEPGHGGVESGEDVSCDVCHSSDVDEENEILTCDRCNVAVHQECYGEAIVPIYSWLCKPCKQGVTPNCILCPNKGGAMKNTRSRHWVHLSCALWIPEVSIGNLLRMEPIIKITRIPRRRWARICVICKVRVGACIRCTFGNCKTAYHVTCAYRNGYVMRPVIEIHDAPDGVKLKSLCLKHRLRG